MSLDPPRCVRRALLSGRSNADILATYPVDALELRRWRWRLRAVARSTNCGVPLEALQAQLTSGATIKQAAAAVNVPAHLVRYLVDSGRLLVRPRSPGYPCPQAWAASCARAARMLRHELAREMLAAGMTVREVAEIIGVTPRAVRLWRSMVHPSSSQSSAPASAPVNT